MGVSDRRKQELPLVFYISARSLRLWALSALCMRTRMAHDLCPRLLRLRTLRRGARLRSFRLSSVPSYRFLLLYAILRLTLYRIAIVALFLHPLSCTLALAASGVILSMKCSLLALLSCRF